MDSSSLSNASSSRPSEVPSELSEEHTELLAKFQDITGKENIDECRHYLEAFNWQLEPAISAALDHQEPSTHSSSQQFDAPPQPTHQRPIASISPAFRSANSTRRAGSPPSGLRLPASVENPTMFNLLPGPLRRIVRFFWSYCMFAVNRLLGVFSHVVSPPPERPALDAAALSDRFLLKFEQRYDRTHPPFFEGSYNQAVRAAQRSSSILLVYVHCDEHDDTDEFCKKTLCAPSVVNFITEHSMMMWAGDLGEAEAYQVSATLNASTFPFVAAIAQRDGRMSVIARIEGLHTADRFISRLNEINIRYGTFLEAQRNAREAQENARRLMAQQEREFQETLRADQERERELAAQREEEERQERLRKEEEERKRLEEERLKEEQRKKEEELRLKQQEKERNLPSEPAATETEITRIIFRLPDGTRVGRRFRPEETVQILYDFIDTKVTLENYVLCSSFPRAQHTDKSLSLKEAKLCPNATLMVEEPLS